MTFSIKELEWLEKCLHQRIHEELRLGYITLDDNQKTLVIYYNSEPLKLNSEESSILLEVLSPSFQQKTKADLSEVFSLVFDVLHRREEYYFFQTDNHDRFPACASVSFRNNWLERPIVDEVFEVIRLSVGRQWPRLGLREKNPEVIVTCDVDNPYEFYLTSHKAFIKKLGGDLIKRKSLSEFQRTWFNFWRSAKQDYSFEPNNNFEWMMDVNEKAGNRMAFYFLVDNSVPAFDAHYSIDEPRIRQLMRRIYDRGHEIGLHASYGTYKNAEQMKKEADKLRQVMDEEGIKQDEIGSRQHYLRWSTPETARHLEAAGITYDTTLGYAEHAGFRCGTSHEFPMFDVENQKILNLREKPLIMMEASVLNVKYMNMGYSHDTLAYMKDLRATCHRYGGTFTMLWHNSNFLNEQDRIFYEELVST